jgi:glycosyltransferase involved in cell wall biosynthesis
MKVSGFTFIKNATKLYIPLRESILSVLPLVDEFVIAIGDNDPDDTTQEIIEEIDSPKIKMIHTVWDTKTYSKNTEFARQTDIAKEACTGDWLIYIQADEAIHESDHLAIKKAMQKYNNDSEIEGLLFHYRHFWGDYKHFHTSHNWYPKEIRIIKNSKNIHSWRDAQSFRKFDTFDYSPSDYNSERGQKLKVKLIDAFIYHYGYVRPPHMMSYKSQVMHSSYHGKKKAAEIVAKQPKEFDYGPLQRLAKFEGTHPAVMSDWIAKFDWRHKLQYSGKRNPNRPMHKHEKLKYRVVTWIEQHLLNKRMIGGFRNYILKK